MTIPARLLESKRVTAMDLVSVLPQLVRSQGEQCVDEFTLITYPLGSHTPGPPDWRMVSPYYASRLADAEKAIDECGLVDEVVRELLSHETKGLKRLGTPDVEGRFGIRAELLTKQKLRAMLQQLSDVEVLAIESPYLLKDGKVAHLPLVDFRCEPNSRRLLIIQRTLAEMGQERGAILQSGRSYHYHGFDVLTGQAWMEFVGNCLLFPYVDVRYLGHRLLSRRFCLRITAARSRSSKGEPHVVAWL